MQVVCGQGQATPCYRNGVHCAERYPGCQGKCEKYMRYWRHNVEVVYPARAKRGALANYGFEETYKSMKRGGKVRYRGG